MRVNNKKVLIKKSNMEKMFKDLGSCTWYKKVYVLPSLCNKEVFE